MDFKSYKICRKYCKFILKLFEQGKVDVSKVREVFEKVVQIYGLDLNNSGFFWGPYLEIE